MAQVKVKIGADGAEFKSALAEMRNEAREFFGEIKELAAKTGEFFGVTMAAEGIKHLIEEFNEVGRQARKFGETAEDMQRIGVAARMTGVDVDSLFTYMTRLDKAVGETASGIKDHGKFFEMMGQSAKDYMGIGIEEKLLKLTEGFEVADKKGLAAVAMFDLLGRGAAGMMPLVSMGSEKFKEFVAQTTVASNDTVEEMEHINEQIEQYTQTLKVWVVTAISGLNAFLWGAATGVISVIKNVEQATAWLGDKVGANTDMLSLQASEWGEAQEAAQEKTNEAMAKLMGEGTEDYKKELDKRHKLQGEMLAQEQKEAEQAEADKARKKQEAKEEKMHKEAKDDYEALMDTKAANVDDPGDKRKIEREKLVVEYAMATTDLERQRLQLAMARLDAEDRKDAKSTLKGIFSEEKSLFDEQIEKLQKRISPERIMDFTVTDARRRGGGSGMEGVGFGGMTSPELEAARSQLNVLIDLRKNTIDILTRMENGSRGAMK